MFSCISSCLAMEYHLCPGLGEHSVVTMLYDDSSWPVLVLGALMFIPGAYHVRIAYYAYKEYPGFTFDDIPDFD